MFLKKIYNDILLQYINFCDTDCCGNGIEETTKIDYWLHHVRHCKVNYSKKFCKFVTLFVKFTWRHVNNLMIRGCVYPFFCGTCKTPCIWPMHSSLRSLVGMLHSTENCKRYIFLYTYHIYNIWVTISYGIFTHIWHIIDTHTSYFWAIKNIIAITLQQ